MKTIKEWLETLPEPYRSQALTALGKYAFGLSKKLTATSLGNALDEGFNWEKTEQGHEYWENISELIHEGKSLAPQQTVPPTNALQAIHAIALKKGFPAEDITSIRFDDKRKEWAYTCKDAGEFFCNLSNE